jgi:multiple sugar transport system substrate-binding protein
VKCRFWRRQIMDEIELTVQQHTPETAAALTALLQQFEAQTHVRVKLRLLDWLEARAELDRVALRGQGPDVSEIGSTWVSELIAMDALRPFSPPELAKIGKPPQFAPASWNTVHIEGDDAIRAMPWQAETYVIHYRKDLLHAAGVDEATAFQTHAQLEQTARRLQASGVPVPVELPLTSDRYGTLHALASWVWGRGGDFCAPDGKRILFDQTAALAALQSYFGLLRYLSPEGRRMMQTKEGATLFHQGQSAMAFGTIKLTRAADIAPEVAANWGAAMLPAPCFVGGTNLVIWRHTRRERAAVELVRFLMSNQALTQANLAMAALPPRLTLLDAPELAHDAVRGVMAQAIKTGRSYPAFRLWGMLEERLVSALLAIGADVLGQPDRDLRDTIELHIKPLAQRLNLTLAQ